jgi:signal peptidase II
MDTLKSLPRSARIVALAVILLDEATKTLARRLLPLCVSHGCPPTRLIGPVELVRLRNAGSALGFVQGLWLWTVLTILGIALVPVIARRSDHPAVLVGAGLLVGGGLANLVDRLFTGGVTDFIHPGSPIVFNLADVALFVGTVTMSVAMARQTPLPQVRGRRRPASEPVTR